MEPLQRIFSTASYNIPQCTRKPHNFLELTHIIGFIPDTDACIRGGFRGGSRYRSSFRSASRSRYSGSRFTKAIAAGLVVRGGTRYDGSDGMQHKIKATTSTCVCDQCSVYRVRQIELSLLTQRADNSNRKESKYIKPS